MDEDKQNGWSEKFRLILLRDENLEKIKEFRLSILQFYTSILLAVLLIIALTSVVIIFTPIKKTIPGYGDITENKVYSDLLNTVQELEKKAVENTAYIEKVQALLNGNHESENSEVSMGTTDSINKKSIVARSEEDELLRKKITTVSNQGLSLPPVMKGENSKPIQGRTLIPPLKGVISAPFYGAKKHYGVDILAPALTPIKSVDNGIVISADWTMETGYTIGVQHDDNLISYYKHNSALLKKTGEKVDAGEAIAIIGNTGHLSSGPHLHFELWYNGKSLDPVQFINFEN
ncbi:MAG: peptidoglycan DD-metalloendopeptidase family protein [Bacteroidetes bacterium]|jgi:murein DD-endopeptidase MepM/ murein hydrolase activator NlpD|nr:peptidoglycan DD-metalloendopeptidase family protein [Bacteroidota bacterium]